ncbi:nuclear protein NHN1, partial [Mytilus galloprovincialis]
MEVDTSPSSPPDQQTPVSPQAKDVSLHDSPNDQPQSVGQEDGNTAEVTGDNVDLNMPSSPSSNSKEDHLNGSQQEEQMEFEEKENKLDESQDYDMKSPVSADIRTDINASVSQSQASELDICNQSSDIDDKMDALSDLKDSDFDTSRVTDSEEIKSEQLNDSVYADERDTTLVEQDQDSDNELDLTSSPDKSFLESAKNENFDTSTQSPKPTDDQEVKNQESDKSSDEEMPKTIDDQEVKNQESDISSDEENFDSNQEEMTSSNVDIDIENSQPEDGSKEITTENIDKPVSSTNLGQSDESEEKICEENLVQDGDISSVQQLKQTEDIDSPENSDIESSLQREAKQSPQMDSGNMLDQVSDDGESQDFKNFQSKQNDMLGPTSPVSDESDFEQEETSHGLKKSEIVDAASPVSDNTDSEQEEGEVTQSRNIDSVLGPASPVSDSCDTEQAKSSKQNIDSMLGPASPVSDISDKELGEITESKTIESAFGPTSPVSDLSDKEQGEVSENKKVDSMIGPASPVSDESDGELEEGETKLSKYDLSGPASPTSEGELSAPSPVSENESFPSDREKGPKSPDGPGSPSEDGEKSQSKVPNGISSFNDRPAQRLEKEYKDISDDDSFSDEEKPPKGILVSEKSAKNKHSEKVRTHISIADDHGELDYMDEDEDEVGKDDKDKFEDSKDGEEKKDQNEREDGEHDSDKDDGEVEDDDDCEEGEIKEPGSRKPFVKPTCRFFMRGLCTWGSNCRFLHPGVNDKGNYRLFEDPGGNSGPPPWEEMEEEDLPPPPPPPPKAAPVESAWERGLRHAKELRKKAHKRKEQEPDFEEKKLNLSVDEEREFNKENDRQNPFYEEQVYDDEYYDKVPLHRTPVEQPPNMWHPAQYENFEVRWNREPEWMPPPYMPREREHFDYPAPRHYSPPHIHRYEKRREIDRRKDYPEERVNNQPQQTFNRPRAADHWQDPWQRSKSPKNNKGRSSRSHSRARRKNRRSHSYSSSFSSSSFSGSSRSGSRSSSYSRSYSRSSSGSRSSSASSKNSRSPSKSPVKRRNVPKKPPKSGPDATKTAGQKSKAPKSPTKRRSSAQATSPKKQPSGAGPPLQPLPPGGRGRGRDRNVPKPAGRGKGRKRSSSGSSYSRSHSSGSSSSRSSSASSISSGSSHSTSTSSGSADSEHLYRGVGGRGSSPSPSPKKKPIKKKKAAPGAGNKNKSQRVSRQSSRGDGKGPQGPGLTSKAKDMLKVTGQKPNIKLTLLGNKK